MISANAFSKMVAGSAPFMMHTKLVKKSFFFFFSSVYNIILLKEKDT